MPGSLYFYKRIPELAYKTIGTILSMAILLSVTACASRVKVPVNPPELRKESLLHVKLLSGRNVKVKKPKFKGEYLLGFTPLHHTRPGPEKEIKIALNEIESIRVERYNKTKTIIFAASAAVMVGSFIYLVSLYAGLSELR